MRQILVANTASWAPPIPAAVIGRGEGSSAPNWMRAHTSASGLCGLLKDVGFRAWSWGM